ncbi:MAG TPA: PQQ-dependent sugar dehydrogenase [Vicinamibacterales bacterium]|nr:PQQ-dependent sugar dehydrogenase [Vicinamibacterales bacterium]
MTTTRTRRVTITAPAVILGVLLTLTVSRTSAERGAQPPLAGPAGAGNQAGPPPGGGRGGANPAAALYVDHCASCHGTDLGGGRAPSLFREQWLATVSDARLTNSIRTGVPNTGMPAFAEMLTDDQVWQLVQYLRLQSGVLKTRPAFVADPSGVVLKTEKATVRLEVIANGLNTPWGLAFLPDGRLLVTERTVNGGTLRVIDKGAVSPPVTGTPTVHVQQDAGMFDVEVHPKYAENGWIYLSYAERLPGYAPPPAPAAGETAGAGRAGGRGGAVAPSMTTIVRGRINGRHEWVDQQVIFRAPANLYSTDGTHFGSRFIFDRQGHLFFSIGERGVMQHAQDLSNPIGKIHRVNDDGSVPRDNPFVSRPDAVPTIWSYGHRNPQGLAWDPQSGRLWESEHGPNAGDEINIIERGRNYGWGVVTRGRQPGITKTSEPGMVDPVVYYIPTFAPSGISFYSGNRYPGWKNTSLFVGGLAGQALRRLQIDGDRVTGQEVIFDQFGRVRDVIEGPDGYLYLALQYATGAGTSYGLVAPSPGLVVRMVPVTP